MVDSKYVLNESMDEKKNTFVSAVETIFFCSLVETCLPMKICNSCLTTYPPVAFKQGIEQHSGNEFY